MHLTIQKYIDLYCTPCTISSTHNQQYLHSEAIGCALQISTVNMGLAVGWAAVVLSFGKKGWRKSLPHSLGEQHKPAARAQCQHADSSAYAVIIQLQLV